MQHAVTLVNKSSGTAAEETVQLPPKHARASEKREAKHLKEVERGRERDAQRSQEAGFDHHLVKPGDFGKVLQILATVSASPPR